MPMVDLTITPNVPKMDEMNSDELKKFRVKHNLSQKELADKLKVATNTIWRWENNDRKIPEFLDLALETIERRIKEFDH